MDKTIRRGRDIRVVVLDPVALEVKEGELLCLVGLNAWLALRAPTPMSLSGVMRQFVALISQGQVSDWSVHRPSTKRSMCSGLDACSSGGRCASDTLSKD